MKVTMIVTLASLLVAAALPALGAQSRQVPIAISDAYIPGGFDSATEAYVIASGIFPNGCYRWKHARVESGNEENLHLVKAYADVSQGMCLMVLVPFTQEISLGVLDSGEHRVRFTNDDGTYMEKKVVIE